jgi:predicted chitinase
VVDSEEEAIAALPEILSYDRRAVWQRFEERFTATRMARDYVSVYPRLLTKRTTTDEKHSTWPRQPNVQNGNGLTPYVD